MGLEKVCDFTDGSFSGTRVGVGDAENVLKLLAVQKYNVVRKCIRYAELIKNRFQFV